MKYINELEVQKQNSIVRGKMASYSLEQLKLLNTIYSIIQLNYAQSKKDGMISIPFKYILSGMGYITPDGKRIMDGKKLYEVFSKEVRDILTDKITVVDYVDENGNKNDFADIVLFYETKVKKSDEKDLEKCLDIKINSTFFHLLETQGLWTKLDLQTMNKYFKSSFQYRLYEFLKSYENLAFKRKIHGEYCFTLTLDEYNETFEVNPIKSLSKALEKINRAINVINKTELGIKLDINKAEKKITFIYTNKIEYDKLKDFNDEVKKSKSSKEEAFIDDIISKIKASSAA